MRAFVGMSFTPYGTDSVGVVTKVTQKEVTYYYTHNKSKLYTVEKRQLAKFAHPAGKGIKK